MQPAWVRTVWLSPERNDSAAGLGNFWWLTQSFCAMGGDVQKNKVRSLRYCNTAIHDVFGFVRTFLPLKCRQQSRHARDSVLPEAENSVTTLMKALHRSRSLYDYVPALQTVVLNWVPDP
jgi:hypothetical protein